jgi:hypothetical protein
LFVTDGELRIIMRKTTVKRSRPKVNIFGISLTITKVYPVRNSITSKNMLGKGEKFERFTPASHSTQY